MKPAGAGPIGIILEVSGYDSDPTVSVVIPAFNAAGTIRSTVQSALRQTERSFDVLVVNDGSTDATERVVAALDDPRVRILSQENRGLPAARNAGISATRGKYVAFLDSDDMLLPDFLESGLAALRERENPGFAYTDAYVLDEASGRLRESSAMARFDPPVPPPRDAAAFLTALLRSNFVYVSTIAPRQVLERVGGFNESLTSCEDYDLWLRILVHGYEAAWFPGRHAIYRLHTAQMTRNPVRMARNLAAVYDDLPLDAMPSERHRALLLRRRRTAHFNLRFLSPIRGLLPEALLLSARRKRNRWYETVPSDVAEAFGSLR
jgi:glycosyltransferase involved in cell wall biosynthesis